MLLDRWVARRSYRKFLAETISLEQFGHFLSCLRGLDLPGLPFLKYQYGSGGGLYPVQAYLYIKPGRIESLAGGAYYYHPGQHRLVQLSTSDGFDRRVHAFTNRAIFDESAFAIFLVGQMAAMTPLYGEQNTRHFCAIEAGLIAQLLEMAAPAQGIGLCQIGSLHFEQVAPLFALDASHLYLHCLIGGPVDQGRDQRQALIEDWSSVSRDHAGSGAGCAGGLRRRVAALSGR